MLKQSRDSNAIVALTGPLTLAMRACRRHIRDAAIFSALVNILYLAPSIYMLQVYDRVVPTRGSFTLLMLTGIFLLAVVTIAGLDLIRTRLLVRAAVRLDRMLAGTIIDALLRSARTSGPRSATILREFDIFRQTATGPGMLALFDAPWSPIYVVVCFLLHPALGMMALVGSMLLLVISYLNERATNKPLKHASAAASGAYAGVDQMLAVSGVVHGLGMRKAMVARAVRERNFGAEMQTEASLKSSGYMAITKAARLMLQSLALGLGALLAIWGEVSVGTIFAASLLISRALAPIELITGAWRNVIQARAAHEAIADLFQEVGPERAHMVLPPPLGSLEVTNIGIATISRDKPILVGISFKLEPGEMLGVVGPSGAGKSTLARALIGAQPLLTGTVRIDGASLDDWSDAQLARVVGYLPQVPSLFRGTIKENIARFETELQTVDSVDTEVVRAAMACGAHDFILRLPQGYETELGAHGAGLSVGQSQRIALARALYGQPKVVVLDEPNASLDAEGEAQLKGALVQLRERKVAVVIVAHRASVLENADKLLVLRDGRIEMFGTRQAVLSRLSDKSSSPPAAASAA